MASLVSKFQEKKAFVDTNKAANPSNKHYRPHHYHINKELDRFDNDHIAIFSSDDSVVAFEKYLGTNKAQYHFTNPYFYDKFKDRK